MKYIRNAFAKLKNGKLFQKLKNVKNVEIIIAVILALLAAVCFFAAAAKKRSEQSASIVSSPSVAEMDEREQRLAAMISEISGVGKSRVMIAVGEKSEAVGVVVVAEGAKSVDIRVKILRCVEKATGVSVDRIEVFEMGNGG